MKREKIIWEIHFIKTIISTVKTDIMSKNVFIENEKSFAVAIHSDFLIIKGIKTSFITKYL